jgi:TonB-dependent starch-binding outer membrane protein SusC
MQMKMRNYLSRGLALVGILMLSVMAFAQQARTVKGKVTDEKGEAIPGVNVSIQGTTIGTITDIDGNYVIEIDSPEKAVLLFSFIGYEPMTVAVGNQATINPKLKEESIGLNEVVAIGYGVVRKKDLTGAVSSIKSDEISKTSSSNAMQAMQAKMPGMDITQASGQAGAKVNITVRGQRSLTASNDPLILVDGVEYGSTLDINPSDIESMDVLKDASSTAIYGSKGANGVILITTKKGKVGKTRVNVNTFWSKNIPTNVPQVMYGNKEVQRLIDKDDYIKNYNYYKANGTWGTNSATAASVLDKTLDDGTTTLSIYEDKSYTNWADLILQDGLTQNYEVSVSGGNDKTTYNLSMGTMLEEGLMKNDEMDRYNAKLVLDHTISNAFKVGANLLYTYKSLDIRNASVFNQSLKMTSITHPYLNDGSMNEAPNPWYTAHANPLLDEVPGNYQQNNESTRFFGNTYLEINPIKDLRFKTLLSLDRTNTRIGTYQDYKSVGRYQSPGTTGISSEYEMWTNLYWENTLNYIKTIGSDHTVSAMIGQTMTQKVYEQNYTSGDAGKEHYYQSSFYDLSKILSETTTSNYVKESLLSYFGRVNYSFKERYLLTASLRSDGQSTLAPGNKWGTFPSVSGAWRVNNESFMSNTTNWMTNLKLRASWGVSGNAAISPYETLTTLSGYNVYYYLGGGDIAGNIPSNMGNEELQWETTEAINLGLDFGLWNNRVSGSVEYYMSETSDLLYYRSAPPSSVYPSVIGNIGSTKGNGIEVSLNTLVVKKKDFSYDINWSYSTYSDEITGLADGLTKNINGNTGQIVGERVSVYFDYEADGNWGIGEFAEYKTAWEERHPGETLSYELASYGTPGSIKIIDRNDDGKLDEEDKKVYQRAPNNIFGMNNTLTYKNISLSFLLYARTGGYISYDMNSQLTYEAANWGDLDYWTPENTGAKFPSPGLNGGAEATFGSYGRALLYEKADFVKIKDITLAYNLPKSILSKVGVERVRVYGSLKNYFTFSDIDNYDPERGGSIAFPLAKQAVFGMNLEF